VLARLDDVPGVEESRIDWSGRHFLLKLDSEDDRDRVVAPAAEILGDGARRLAPDAEAERSAAFPRGEPGMRLSAEEARVLAERFTAEASKDAGLDEAKTRKLQALVEDETRRLLESLHAEGGAVSARFMEGWTPAAERVQERSRAFLAPEEAERVGARLRERFLDK
jgi:hypothetical protein